jgi:dipeptidyl aminopeptidase/acylaminoacyl peptidase
VNIFGPVDLTTDFGKHHPTATSFIGKSYEEAPELYREASPIVYVDKNSPPTMTIQGTSDELVPNSQADQLKQRLDSLGVPCVDYRFPLWPHAMIVVQRVYDYCLPKMNDFLDKYLLNSHEQSSQTAD